MKFIRPVYILSILLIGFFSCTGPEKKDAPKTNVPAEKATPKDNLTELNDGIQANPEKADLYFQRAQIFVQRNVMSSAFSDASKAVQLDSNKVPYLLLLADISFKTYQIRKASDCFERVTKIDPKNPEGYLKLSELYFYIKGYQKSIFYANEALKIDKHLVKAYYLKGFVYKEKGDTALAVSSFNTVVDLQPEDYDAYIQLGNIYSVRRSFLALQYYNNALRLRPSSTEALYNRGLFLQNTNEVDKAMLDYRTILKIDPSYSDAYYNMGYINSVMRKNYKDAIVNYTDAIRTNDQYAEAFYNRGVCYEMLGDKASARKDYTAALGVVPTYKEAKARLQQLAN